MQDVDVEGDSGEEGLDWEESKKEFRKRKEGLSDACNKNVHLQ